MEKKKSNVDNYPQCMNDVFGPAVDAWHEGESLECVSLMTDMENWVRDHGVEVSVSPHEDGEDFNLELGGKRVSRLTCDSCLALLTGMGTLIEYLNKSMEDDESWTRKL